MSKRLWKRLGWLRFAFAGLQITLVAALITACDPPRELTSGSSRAGASGAIADAEAEPSGSATPASGDVLLVGGWTSGNKSTATAEFFDPAHKKFVRTGSMLTKVALNACAVLTDALPHAEVVAAGGFSGTSKFWKRTVSQTITGSDPTTNNLETFDPATGKFTAANADLLMIRFAATATTLPSGKILVAGGADSSGNPTNTAEVFDPASGMTAATANNMASARVFHTATLLNDGTVLIAGGATDKTGDLTASADIYDPATNSFSPAGAMVEARGAHAATPLTSGPLAGQVLITGGVSGNSAGLLPLTLAETYNPATKAFILTAHSMNDPRAFHTATALQGGKVLMAGGFSNFFSTVNGGSLNSLFGSNLSSAEIYDPASGTFTCINGTNGKGGNTCSPAMSRGRGGHSATLFQTGPLAGQVLIAGGLGAVKPNATATELNEAELFNPVSNAFTKTKNLKTARGLHCAVLLP